MNTLLNPEIIDLLKDKGFNSESTTSDVLKWLKENHNIRIQIHGWTNQPVDNEIWKNCFSAYINGDNMDASIFRTETDATETAIKYVLKNYL